MTPAAQTLARRTSRATLQEALAFKLALGPDDDDQDVPAPLILPADVPSQPVALPKHFLTRPSGLSDKAFRMRVFLALEAMDQPLPGTLPNDDARLAELAGVGHMVSSFRRHKAKVLEDWLLCADNRWHHPELAEPIKLVKAAETAEARERAKAAARQRKHREETARQHQGSLDLAPVTATPVERDAAESPAVTPPDLSTTTFEVVGGGVVEPTAPEPEPDPAPAPPADPVAAVVEAFDAGWQRHYGRRRRRPHQGDRAVAAEMLALGLPLAAITAEIERQIGQMAARGKKAPWSLGVIFRDIESAAATASRAATVTPDPTPDAAPDPVTSRAHTPDVTPLPPPWPDGSLSALLAAGLDLVKVRQFLSPCHLSHPPDGPWRLAAPSRFQRDWIRERYADTLARVLGGEVEVVMTG